MRKIISAFLVVLAISSVAATHGTRGNILVKGRPVSAPEEQPKSLEPKDTKPLPNTSDNADTVILMDGTLQQETVIKIDGNYIHFKGGKIATQKARKVKVVLPCAEIEILFSTPPIPPVIKITRQQTPDKP